jgi:hypothetical protein
MYKRCSCAKAGETKHNPVLKTTSGIKPCILELPVTFIILSPVNGFQRCGTLPFANPIPAALLFAPHDSPPAITAIQLKICQAKSI